MLQLWNQQKMTQPLYHHIADEFCTKCSTAVVYSSGLSRNFWSHFIHDVTNKDCNLHSHCLQKLNCTLKYLSSYIITKSQESLQTVFNIIVNNTPLLNHLLLWVLLRFIIKQHLFRISCPRTVLVYCRFKVSSIKNADHKHPKFSAEGQQLIWMQQAQISEL